MGGRARSATRVIALLAALVLLNASLTFANIWPTLGIWWSGGLSVELALLVLALYVARRRWPVDGRGTVMWLAIGWLMLIVARYVDVTTQSLFGRSPSLYWDLQFVPDVSAMFAVVASPWRTLAVIAGVLGAVALLYVVARWAMTRLVQATADPRASAVLVPGAVAVCLLGAAQATGVEIPSTLRVAAPASQVYAVQAGEILMETLGAGLQDLPPSPVMHSDFSRVRGADVLLIFVESYGVASWERPELADGLVPSRLRLDTDIRETGRAVSSALVESTTFGGESWLSHLSLLSGIEVRDERTTLRLMAETRNTLVKTFGNAGYRTVAVMPGLLTPWPEGDFYGYDEIYSHAELDYRGPPFGWWDLNDQFALARVDALEIAPLDRRPVFLVMPTITTHAPFTPVPPYQPDWVRLLGDQPYDMADVNRAWEDQPDWTNLAPSYVNSMAYAHAMIGGYLRHRADRDFVMVLVGDHQPPALVSGEGAAWSVPVHVISKRPALADRLLRHGFRDGLRPGDQVIARMDGLLPILLDAFGDAGE